MFIYKVAKYKIWHFQQKKIKAKYYIWLSTNPKRIAFQLPYVSYTERCKALTESNEKNINHTTNYNFINGIFSIQ